MKLYLNYLSANVLKTEIMNAILQRNQTNLNKYIYI